MTNYIRDDDLESAVIITQGEILTIEVPHVFSEEVAITPALDINLMQPVDESITFVNFNEDASDSTLVIIDTSDELIGVYTLKLLSFSTLDPGVSCWFE